MANNETNALLEAWFADNVVEDVEECLTIGGMAKEQCLQKLNVDISPKSALALYSITFKEIVKKLMSKREDEKGFVINIANVVKVGYDDTEDDEEAETNGNFNIFIEEVGKAPIMTEDDSLLTLERCVQWMSLNVKEQPKIIEGIATAAIKSLADEADVHLMKPEVLFPIWCIIHNQMVGFIKARRTETNSYDYMINFAGNFDAHCQMLESGEVVISYKPHIADKLNIKSNLIATAPSE